MLELVLEEWVVALPVLCVAPRAPARMLNSLRELWLEWYRLYQYIGIHEHIPNCYRVYIQVPAALRQ